MNDIERMKANIARMTGIAPDKLDRILAGMVETMTIRASKDKDSDDGAWYMWDFYLAGSCEVLIFAGAWAHEVEQLVAILYDQQQKEGSI